MPVTYSVAGLDRVWLTFGHVNALGAVRPLPAVALAIVCGYVASTATFALDREALPQAVGLLTAEAATHVGHPIVWSWRQLPGPARPGPVCGVDVRLS